MTSSCHSIGTWWGHSSKDDTEVKIVVPVPLTQFRYVSLFHNLPPHHSYGLDIIGNVAWWSILELQSSYRVILYKSRVLIWTYCNVFVWFTQWLGTNLIVPVMVDKRTHSIWYRSCCTSVVDRSTIYTFSRPIQRAHRRASDIQLPPLSPLAYIKNVLMVL